MDEWHDFFLTEAGAAGVLTGLVFVGVSINLEKIVADPRSGLAGRAAEALILLVAVLTASSLLLVPGQGGGLVGLEVLAVGGVAWAWTLAIQLLNLIPSTSAGGGTSVYEVTIGRKGESCECRDHGRRGATCKHIVAATIARAKTAACDGCGGRFPRRELFEVGDDHLTFFEGDELCRPCAHAHGVL